MVPLPPLPETPKAPPVQPGGKPNDSSLPLERVVQGLPPMQVAPSVEHLYEGHLGEFTKGWGSDLTIPPNPNPLIPLPAHLIAGVYAEFIM